MKLFFNRITGILGTTPTATTNVQKLTAKRYQDYDVELIPVNEAGEVDLFSTGATGLLVVKKEKEFTGDAKILDAAWDVPTVEGRGYIFSFLAAGVGIDTELGSAASKPFALEIVVVDGRRIPMPTIQFIIENNYWREDDPPPADPENPLPLPGEILVKSGNLAGLADTAVSRANLGINAAWLAPLLAAADLSGLPTSDPGGGKLWLNGGVLQVGAA